jgi:glycosyltransferase involved in cell wall biosynthesis
MGVSAMNSEPTVSVVLSVRNGGNDLPHAIGTILKQSFTDFELIAINNGSIDGTGEFLDQITDPRVRVYHQEDKGLAAALNRGISLARGSYIARQDHDDWARPTRIAQQVAFLDANPDCALIGTRAEIWVGDQPTGRFHDHPTEDADPPIRSLVQQLLCSFLGDDAQGRAGRSGSLHHRPHAPAGRGLRVVVANRPTVSGGQFAGAADHLSRSADQHVAGRRRSL